MALEVHGIGVLYCRLFSSGFISYTFTRKRPYLRNGITKKRKEILKNFEKEISGKKGDDNSICDLLKRQTVQDLYYLRAGLKDRIFSCRAGGMTTMSIREEEYLDMEIKYYERLLTLTNRYIPEEDER